MNEDAELLAVFKAEVAEQLESLNEQLSRPAPEWAYEALFHLAHNVKGAARMTNTRGVMEAAHALEDLFDVLRAGKRDATSELIALVREGAELLHECFDAIGSDALPDVVSFQQRVEEALGDPAKSAAQTSTDAAPAPGPEPAEVMSAPSGDAPEPAKAAPAPATNDQGATIRIAMDRLQSLMELSAEFVTSVHRAEAQRQSASAILDQLERVRRASPALARAPEFQTLTATLKEMHRAFMEDGSRSQQVAEQLHDAIRQLRMVRTDSLRGVLSRVVRSAAQVHGRLAEFVMEGGETEIDRAILERLRDPLVHLVRNAVAHGIEPADARSASGKAPAGTVRFGARSAGSWVEIVISDDGRGVDLERLRARAIELGVLDERKAGAMEDEELTETIFHPGLSTASEISEVAGRGFGMDIVRSNVVELGGSVNIVTRKGRGTEVQLRAPLTRLTTRGLVVSVAGQRMAIPIMAVERTVSVDRERVRVVDGREVTPAEGGLLPVASLGTVLGLEHEPAARCPAIVVSEGHRQGAYLVDEIIGEQEFTMQSLSWNLRQVPCVAGGAVVEAGDVLLVLNAHELLNGKARRSTGRAVASERSESLGRRRRILVTDDSVTSRTLEKNILASAGYEVLMATNGEAALEVLRVEDVDLVISDVDMPKMGGIELTRRIRASDELNRLPLILITSLGGEEDRQRGAAAGADAYIVKGEFDQDELLRTVARLL
jgi:two-component system, chemotaxis family, sensor kinase CheA